MDDEKYDFPHEDFEKVTIGIMEQMMFFYVNEDLVKFKIVKYKGCYFVISEFTIHNSEFIIHISDNLFKICSV